MPSEIAKAANALLPDVVALRRAIHAEPEIGLHTPLTTRRVLDALAGLPLEIRRSTATTGIVAVLKGAKAGRSILLRGDMDALPIHEETGLPFASTVAGAMHACGHDAHTAMLVGAARLLSAGREALAGEVLFMFQPGEEGWHGARYMLDEDLLDPLPDAAFALHVMPRTRHGVLTGRAGALLASQDPLLITVVGRGGHASAPHDTIDPVPVACEIVTAIQSLVTRKVSVFDPAVVSVTRLDAGSAHNVIPDTARLQGTIRALSEDTRARVHEALATLASGIAAAHGATAHVEREPGFPVTVCDPRMVALGRAAVEEMFGADAFETLPNPLMAAEDFAYVLQQVPGAMLFLGAARAGVDANDCCGLHNGGMVIDEAVMARGIAVHAAIARRFLDRGFSAP